LADSQPTPQPAREPVRVKPLYLILGGLGVVAVIAVAILLLTRKGDGTPGDDGDGGVTPTTAHFTFKIDPPQALITSPDTNPAKADKVAKPAASQAEKLIHDFYVNAFLNTGAWTDGAYTGVFNDFSNGAKAKAVDQLDVMTAGTAAADTFDSIKAKDASLKEKVLIDPNGQPYSVVAVVSFSATVNLKDGTTQTLVSQGQYILEKVGSGWQVTSFSVTRSDEKPSASTSGSATPTAVAS
jgi:hypothetical protein